MTPSVEPSIKSVRSGRTTRPPRIPESFPSLCLQFGDPRPDQLTHDRRGEWIVRLKPNRSLARLVGGQLALEGVQDGSAERIEGKVILRGTESRDDLPV